MRNSDHPQNTDKSMERDATVQISCNANNDCEEDEKLSLSNDIELIVHRLMDIDQRNPAILKLAEHVKQQRAEVAHVEAILESIRGWMNKDREHLLRLVKYEYVDSEIETADALFNRIG